LIAAVTSSMSFSETLSGASTLIAGILSAVVLIWIYFESQREKDRNERRAARHSEIIARIEHSAAISKSQHDSLEQKFDGQMEALLTLIKEQGRTLRNYGEKIEHFDRTVHAMDKRVAVLEANSNADRADAPGNTGGKGKG